MNDGDARDDIIRWIRQNHESLSPSQQKVAEFLLQGGINVIHLTITEIAGQVGVNSSTVVRTAQALGFEGFPQLQSVMRGQFLNQARIAQRLQIGSQQLIEDLASGQPAPQHLFNAVLRDEVQSLLDLPQHVPAPIFDRAVDMVDAAEQVFIIGLGASFPLALNFGIMLRFIRPDTTILTPGIDSIAAQLEPLGEGDLIFSLCFARYIRDTLTAMEVGRERGAANITVTDSQVSPAAKRADLALIVPYRLRLFSDTAALCVTLDAILGALSLRYPELTRARLDSLEELYARFQMHDAHD